MADPGRRARLFNLVALALLATWAVVALFVVPGLIRHAYAGTSWSFFNAIIRGQSSHPVGDYLRSWHAAALRLTAALVVMLALVRFHKPLWLAVRRGLRADPRVGFGATVLTGAWFGYVSGVAEAGSVLIRVLFSGDPREAPPPDNIWMAPMASALAGVLAGVLVATLLRARRGLSLRVVVALLSVATVYSWIVTLHLGLYHWAVLVLSAGIALQLASYSAGHPRGFERLIRRSWPWLVVPLLLVAVGIHGVAHRREQRAISSLAQAPDSAPNVLLLVLDTVRGDELSLFGYPRATTPEIDRWAGTGTAFRYAIAPAPWTLPSHASLFTSWLPRDLSTNFDQSLDGAAPTLAEILRRRGYLTAGFVANLIFCTRASGLDRGFAVYRDFPTTMAAFLNSSGWTRMAATAVASAMGYHAPLVHKDAEEINRDFLDWLPHDGHPFFAFLNYMDAHEPYLTHAPFDRRFTARPPRYWILQGWRHGYTPEELTEIRDAYDSALAYLDHQVGLLLAELSRRGVLDNTLVVLVGDHGEQLGEHGLTSHANSLYLPLLHVPLILSYPGHVPAGTIVAQPVGTRDVAATILDLLKVSSDTVRGKSLARYWSGVPVPHDPAPTELTYNNFSDKADPIRRGPMQSLVLDSLHYIRNGDDVEELYDFLSDPGELHNLADSAAGQRFLPRLRSSLDTLTRGHPSSVYRSTASPGSPGPTGAGPGR